MLITPALQTSKAYLALQSSTKLPVDVCDSIMVYLISWGPVKKAEVVSFEAYPILDNFCATAVLAFSNSFIFKTGDDTNLVTKYNRITGARLGDIV
jgi:hypothetical protein